MTDPGLADATYIEPITPEFVEKIIARERPNVPPGRVFALLPTMGGQTALNTALSLRKRGVLEKYDVELIGASADAIDKAEDRELFRRAMMKIGLDVPRGITMKGELRHKKDDDGNFLYDARNNPIMELAPESATRVKDALAPVGLPAVIRPPSRSAAPAAASPTTRKNSSTSCEAGLDASPTNEVLIEESVLGWKEFEMEVVRDNADNAIIICSIENVDPMGVHTGDSITVAPALTLTDKEYQRMRTASIAVLARDRRRDRRIERAVRGEPGRRPHGHHRDEPARVALLGAGVEGHRLSDRQGRGQARRRLHARRTPERHHAGDAGLVRADHRLRRHQDPALRLREIPRRRTAPHHFDEIGRRSRWPSAAPSRKSLQKALRSLETGLTGSRRNRHRRRTRTRSAPRLARATPDRPAHRGASAAPGRAEDEIARLTDYDPWFLGESKRSCASKSGPRHGPAARCAALAPAEGDGLFRCAARQARRRNEADVARARAKASACIRCSSASTPAPPNSRRQTRTCTRPTNPRSAAACRTCEARPTDAQEDHHPRRRAQPHRPGHRVRLLLLPRRFRAARPATRPSWSTAIRKPCRPTTTPPTGSISSR